MGNVCITWISEEWYCKIIKVSEVIKNAKSMEWLEQLKLSIISNNIKEINLYTSMKFEIYAKEKMQWKYIMNIFMKIIWCIL